MHRICVCVLAQSPLLCQEFLYRNRSEELVDVRHQNGRPLLTGSGNSDTRYFRQILIDQIQDHSICRENVYWVNMKAYAQQELLLPLTEIAVGEDAVGQYTSIADIDVRIEAMQTEALIAAGQLFNVAIGQYGGLDVICGKGKISVNELQV